MTKPVNPKLGAGQRHNAGKPPLELIPLHLLEETAKVFAIVSKERGGGKYPLWNWLNGMPWLVPAGALLRHLSRWSQGEDTDEETGLRHSAHMLANVLIIINNELVYPSGDDRPCNRG